MPALNVGVLAAAAALLAVERLTYVWVWRNAAAFRAWCERDVGRPRDPVQVLQVLFTAFKLLQAGVFVWWGLAHGDGRLWPLPAPWPAVVAGAALVAFGQSLGLAVFVRLGRLGVFYGNRFGHQLPWQRGFPFSWFAHPQYVGAVVSIWGVFLMTRYPHPDWAVLPLLETAYYMAGAHFEQ